MVTTPACCKLNVAPAVNAVTCCFTAPNVTELPANVTVSAVSVKEPADCTTVETTPCVVSIVVETAIFIPLTFLYYNEVMYNYGGC